MATTNGTKVNGDHPNGTESTKTDPNNGSTSIDSDGLMKHIVQFR